MPALVALGLLTIACTQGPARSTGSSGVTQTAPAATSARASAPADASESKGQLPVSEAVAKLHRNAFQVSAMDPKQGRVTCFVTLHDPALARGSFFPLALFADGGVATWRQTPTGSEEPFFAQLSADEQARAAQWVAAIPSAREKARKSFPTSALVMGVSVRVDEEVVTLWFEHDEVPAPLGSLVAMLKQRLEATNRAL
jgi:hypothetical protein